MKNSLPMKNWLLISSLLVFLFKVLPCMGQNLVNNGGFETIYSCPTNEDQLNKAKGWFVPNMSSPDLLSTCSTNIFSSIPLNYSGYQQPYTGQNYAHFLVDNLKGYSYEYVSFNLTKSLKSATTYEVKFFLSLAENSNHGMDRIGAFFSSTKPYYNTFSRIEEVPQISSKKGRLLNDTLEWMEVRDTFLATGSELYITIGQFFPEDSLQFSILPNPLLDWASYYIDGVELTEILVEPEISIPNVFTPNNDGVNDALPISITNGLEATTQIFNRWGSVVFESDLLNPVWDGTYNGNPVADGVYFVVVQATGSGGALITENQTVHIFR